MDVTRYTYTPLNPYQGPREAGERADLLLPGLGGKGHQAAMLGLDQHGWQYQAACSRGGARQANAALHHIVKNRMINDPRTRTYRDAHLAKG